MLALTFSELSEESLQYRVSIPEFPKDLSACFEFVGYELMQGFRVCVMYTPEQVMSSEERNTNHARFWCTMIIELQTNGVLTSRLVSKYAQIYVYKYNTSIPPKLEPLLVLKQD